MPVHGNWELATHTFDGDVAGGGISGLWMTQLANFHLWGISTIKSLCYVAVGVVGQGGLVEVSNNATDR